MQSSVTNSAYVSFDGNGRPGAVTFCPFSPCGAGKIEFEQKGEWIDIDGNAIGGANGGVE
jgi:hypothetical protein